MSEQKPKEGSVEPQLIDNAPGDITFHASAFKIGSDYLCMNFGINVFINHDKCDRIIFEYKDGKKYTYKKVKES